MVGRTSLVVLIVALTACGGGGARPAAHVEPSEGLSVKAKVRRLLVDGIAGANPAVIRGLLGAEYRQHNPHVTDGPQGLIGMVERLARAPEQAPHVRVVRTIEDGEYVVGHSEYSRPGYDGAGFDMFRVQGGRFVEHWDAGERMPRATPNGHTMLDGPTDVTDLGATSTNKALVDRFVRDALVGRDLSAWVDFFDGDRLLQHDPRVADGAAAWRVALEAPPAGAPRHEELRRVLGEGNFVVTQSRGVLVTPVVVYDLFRVEAGKLAEHWSVFQRIPAESANHNGML